MSRFASIFEEIGVPALMEHGGRSVIFHDPEQQPVTLTAIVGDVAMPGESDAEGNVTHRQVRTVTIGKDPDAATGGLASVSRDGTFAIDGVLWAVDRAAPIEAQIGRAHV